MKTLVSAVCVMVFLFTTAFASDINLSADQTKAAIQGFEWSLKSSNAGVRHSSLHVIAKFKSEYPSVDLSELNKTLIKMSRNESEPLIRVHASLTYQYINSSKLVNLIKVTDPEDPMVFFNELYKELTTEYLSYTD